MIDYRRMTLPKLDDDLNLKILHQLIRDLSLPSQLSLDKHVVTNFPPNPQTAI